MLYLRGSVHTHIWITSGRYTLITFIIISELVEIGVTDASEDEWHGSYA